jgi:hypothetical protein
MKIFGVEIDVKWFDVGYVSPIYDYYCYDCKPIHYTHQESGIPVCHMCNKPMKPFKDH